NEGQAFGKFQGSLETVGQSRLDVLANNETIDHDIDVVFQFLVERRRLGNLVELAVHFDALKTALQEFRKILSIFALPAAHDRSQEINSGAFLERHDTIDHLRDGLALDRQPSRGRV